MKQTALARAVIRAIASTQVEPDYISMTGGLDQLTAPLSRKPGTARNAQNFEAVQLGGYRRIPGYERFDGQDKPSDALYAVLAANITGAAAVGDTLTGGTSGATGVIIALPGDSFVLTKVVGTFQAAEDLDVGAGAIATATAAQVESGAATIQLDAQYLNLAADEYRTDIDAVPGAGAILGGFWFDDVNYAFRNDAGATAAELYKSTASGWSLVALGRELAFTSGGVTEIEEGDTIEGATSGATAEITRVVLESGTWAAGTAAGRFIFASQTGTFQAEDIDVGAGANLATIAGDSSAITLLPGGRYETIKENFGGSANTTRVYGCDGVNRGFEFDGTVFVPIDTGMTVDTPTHVFAHKKHLFFSFAGSAQHSGPGTPYVFTLVLGAGEIGMGDTITGFAGQPGTAAGAALAIFTRNRLSILYGDDAESWQLVPYRDELGAYAHTIQDVGFTLFFDDRGITDIQTTQSFGNFAHNAISNQIKNLVNAYRALTTASCISRDRSQYRLFFSNSAALYVTVVGRKIVGIMPMLFSDVARCAWSSEMNDGTEVMFFGSDDGWVFQMDKGTSFDGEAIEYFLELAYNFAKSPRVIKRYRDAMLEIEGSGYAEFSFGYSLGYGSTERAQPATQSVATSLSPVFWDSFVWDSFIWDGLTLLPTILKMDGEAENYSLSLRGSSDQFQPFTLTGAVVQHTPRRRMR